MTKNEWTTEEVLQDITKQLENKEKNIDLLRTRIRSKIRRIEKLCTSNKKLHEENTKLKTENKWYSEQLNEAVKEVAKLKELLTMAREVLKMVDTYSGDYDSINGFLIVEKIDKVLGEE